MRARSWSATRSSSTGRTSAVTRTTTAPRKTCAMDDSDAPRADPDGVGVAGESPGAAMHALARRLFPITRSITGDGVRETLRILGEHLPLEFHEVPTGSRAFDWTVPAEWSIRDAYILDEHGDRIVDFRQN